MQAVARLPKRAQNESRFCPGSDFQVQETLSVFAKAYGVPREAYVSQSPSAWRFTKTPYNSSSVMALKSFIDVSRDSHFPIQNLPLWHLQPKQGKPHVGAAIAQHV